MLTSIAARRALVSCCVLVALSLLSATASAETMVIQYTGLNLTYDGSTISTVGVYDPLESVDFFVDDAKMLSYDAPADSPLSIDLIVPGVFNLAVGGDTVVSNAGGYLDLLLPGGDYLTLTLGQSEVHYVAIQSLQLYFLLAAGSADVVQQLLPVGGFAGDIAVSFSTQVVGATLTDDGTNVTGFLSAGTGEIRGTMVPEPTSVALLVSGLLACFAVLRRRM